MLEVRDLVLTADGYRIIDGLDLEVSDGEIHSILGANGTGKTTLAYILMGIYSTHTGRIIFDGEDITSYSTTQRAKMGITLAWQEPARFEGLRIQEYLGLGSNERDVGKYLGMVGLSSQYLERMADDRLSGGERKRVELASVLAMKPRLAILDEPDSGIDIPSLPFIIEAIREIKRRGSSVLLITHSEEMAEIADRTSIICAGRIIRVGNPEEACEYFKQFCKECDHINLPMIEEQGEDDQARV